jgi:hypothetical protein
MTRSEFNKAMEYALDAYGNGYPVVIFSRAEEPLHGHEFLQTVIHLSMPLDACFVKGVPLDLWNDSEYPDQLEEARKRFMGGDE